MPDHFSIRLSETARAVQARLGDAPAMLRAVARAMDSENQFTIAHISERRMRGNNGKSFPPELGILGIRTGHLRRSIRASRAVVSGGTVESTIGSNLAYAGVHEEGFTGEVTVAPSKRQVFKLEKIFGKRRKVRKADRAVSSYRRRMNIPARAPMQRGVEDRIEAYGEAVSQAIVNAWEKT